MTLSLKLNRINSGIKKNNKDVISLRTSTRRNPFKIDLIASLKRRIETCNGLFKEPDCEVSENNYGYHAKYLIDLISLKTKTVWSVNIKNPVIRLAQKDEGKDQYRMIALFWTSEKSFEAKENFLFSIDFNICNEGIKINRVNEGGVSKKVVPEYSKRGLETRKKNSKRRLSQINGTGSYYPLRVPNHVMPCLYPFLGRTDFLEQSEFIRNEETLDKFDNLSLSLYNNLKTPLIQGIPV